MAQRERRLVPAAIDWTEDMATELLRLRRLGMSAKDIGERLGVSAHAVFGQLSRVGDPAKDAPEPEAPAREEAPDRAAWGGAMRPGHEVTWGTLVKGTLLDGIPYPSPADLKRRSKEGWS